jgi:TRAP-type C4-dicarboxylate transport system substrate-binding protein
MIRRMHRVALGLAVVCALAHGAWGDPVQMRIATVAPDGTLWARELKAFANQISSETGDAVKVKWIFGGIAGDEMQLEERIRRGQLDGVASGGPLCAKLAPSLRAFTSPGLFLDRGEASYVLQKMYPRAEEEMAKRGFVLLGVAGVGPMMIFSRTPIRNMSDLIRTRLWVWTEDAYFIDQWKALGVKPVPTLIYEAGRSYQEGKVDAMISTPTAALAFQWTTLTPYLSELRIGYLNGCVAISARAFDALNRETQLTIRAAAAKLNRRFEDAGRVQDEALLGGLLSRHGLHITPVDATFRSDFFEAARTMREHLPADLLGADILGKIQSLLADYRAEHDPRAGSR